MGPLETAVRAQVEALPAEVQSRGIAALAIALATRMDSGMSDTPYSMNARALENVLDKLDKVAPAKAERDVVDEVSERRDARRAAVASGS